MKIDVLTLFPNSFSYLNESIIGRAQKSNIININIHNIRDFAYDKYKKCDDEVYGGGAGMVMKVEPIAEAIETIDKQHKALRIFLLPRGKQLNNNVIQTLKQYDNIILVCGHYEGVDERAIQLYSDCEISIGEYVLTGGELAAIVVIDAVCRQIDGVINKKSLEFESFSNNDIIEYPQYTRPRVYKNMYVPEVLLNGNHQQIQKWKEEESKKLTKKRYCDNESQINKI